MTTAALRGQSKSDHTTRKPNIVLIIADQVRSDAVGAYGINPMGLTPNIDAMARDGVLYRHMHTNQPVCSPARASLFTGQYPCRHGVWKNTSSSIGLSPTAATLATECRKAGYAANYIGKWHLAPGTTGAVKPANRGGFLDLWEAANALEHTSEPYHGEIYDGDGRAMSFNNEYRADFLTGRVERFLKNTSKQSPFLLVLSFLEPHQQNNLNRMVAPNGYAEQYRNPFVPEDLKFFPGDWQEQLPDYYGSLKRVDECVGKVRETLAQEGLDKNTIVVFVSDHGCHFRTRNTEFKRSAHDASTKVPLVITGPGFPVGYEVREFVSIVDLMPTLLDAAGISIPEGVQGHSTLPLFSNEHAPWNNEVFIQLSEFWIGRALKTPDWTYAAVAPRDRNKFQPQPNAPVYFGFQLYNNRADPHQLVNLAGRRETSAVEQELGRRLQLRMKEAGDSAAELLPSSFPYT